MSGLGADSSEIWQLVAALGIGLLIGLERERGQRLIAGKPKHIEAAGIRTFALVSLSGLLTTWLPAPLSPWFTGLGLVFIASLALASYWRTTRSRRSDTGITSEVVLVLTYLLGTLTGLGYLMQSTITAVIVVSLLYFKKILHRFSHSLSAQDIRQTVQFLILTIVILPVLPDHDFGPYGSLNPHEIWLMVVLISGLGFAGYAGIKILGSRKGLGVTGLLGGLVSSTAVTLAMSRLSRARPLLGRPAILAIVMASGIMFPRVWLLTLLFMPPLTWRLTPTVLSIMSFTAVAAYWLGRRSPSHPGRQYTPPDNPLSFKTAVGFGLLYGLVVLLAHLTQEHFGSGGLLTLASLSGLTDVDAITLTITKMLQHELTVTLAAQAILVACISNTLLKLGLGLVFADPGLRPALVAGLLPMALLSLAGLLML